MNASTHESHLSELFPFPYLHVKLCRHSLAIIWYNQELFPKISLLICDSNGEGVVVVIVEL